MQKKSTVIEMYNQKQFVPTFPNPPVNWKLNSGRCEGEVDGWAAKLPLPPSPPANDPLGKAVGKSDYL